jgi:hypothetical protein
MTSSLLDHFEEQGKKRISIKAIPLAFLWIGFLLNAYIQWNFMLFPLSLILGATVLYFFQKNLSLVLTLLIFLLGIFGLIGLSPIEIYLGISIVQVEFISLIGFIGTLLLNKESIKNSLLPGTMDARESESKQEYFLKRFEKKSIDELQKIVNDDARLAEARKAASILLEKKQSD